MSSKIILTITNRFNPRKVFGNLWILIAGFLWLTGCATPSERFSATANELGFFSDSIEANSFEHQIYFNQEVIRDLTKNNLHIYLDGDGSPWEQKRWIAKDPTSRNPVILELMAIDKQPAVFLGRPCYHGYSETPQCHHKFWTSHRYSKQVVDSLATALKALIKAHEYDRVTLIGFSGGGALALLMTPEVPEVKTVVTLASNLDIAAWSKHHGYKPLQGSLNPADLHLDPKIKQIHIVGAEDKLVPPFVVESYLEKQNGSSTYLIYKNQDHFCCWTDQWEEILQLF